MKSKKGFTLVELLAVIVILAIILVIGVSKILTIYKNARRETYRNSVGLIINAAKNYANLNMLEDNSDREVAFTCDGNNCRSGSNLLGLGGKIPLSGMIYVTGSGLVSIENLFDGEFYANAEEGGEVSISEETTVYTRGELTTKIDNLESDVTSLQTAIDGKANASSLGTISGGTIHPVILDKNITSSTSWTYSGLSITIPANSYYSLSVGAYNYSADALGVTLSSNTSDNHAHVYDYGCVYEKSAGATPHAQCSAINYTSSELTLYVWTKYGKATQNGVSLRGFYVTMP